MFDALKQDYKLNPAIEQNLWLFCELALTTYTLKKVAEVLGRGGSNFADNNPLAETIKNPREVKRINETVLPAIFNNLAVLYNQDIEQ